MAVAQETSGETLPLLDKGRALPLLDKGRACLVVNSLKFALLLFCCIVAGGKMGVVFSENEWSPPSASVAFTQSSGLAKTGQADNRSHLVYMEANAGYEDLACNWMRSVRKAVGFGVINQFVYVYVDSEDTKQAILASDCGWPEKFMTDKTMSLGTATRFNTDEIAAKYSTPKYGRVVLRRPERLMRMVEVAKTLGYKYVLYNDADTVWTEDLRRRLPEVPAIATSTDEYTACTGVMLFNVHNPAIPDVLNAWIAQLKRPQENPFTNQGAFNKVLAASNIHYVALNKFMAPSGDVFNKNWNNKELILQKAAIVHANYRVGREKKVAFFKALGLWSFND